MYKLVLFVSTYFKAKIDIPPDSRNPEGGYFWGD